MDAEVLEAARVVAFRFLGYTARSRAEIERRLERGDFPPDVVVAVVEECVARGWVDDEQFAQQWVTDRADRKQYGKSRLAAELWRKGIEKEVVQDALEQVEEEDELERARKAAQTKWHTEQMEEADREVVQAEKRRLANFLQRRGFSWQIITKVLSELVSNRD